MVAATGIAQCLECVRDSTRIRPEPRDDIAIVHGVLWLDAGGQPELRESGNIRRLQHLGVLDGTVGVCARRRVEHDGVRLIADGMACDGEPMACRHVEIRLDLVGRVTERAVKVGEYIGIRHRAERRTGVQRAVRDHLHRADVAQSIAAGQLDARLPAGFNRILQPFGMHARLHAQSSDAMCE